MKLIREARMGLPKTFKTGAVVGTYPKPLLWLGWNIEELDIIPSRKVPTVPGNVPLDIVFEDIKVIKPDEIRNYTLLPADQLPKVLAVDFGSKMTGDPLQLQVYRPIADSLPMQQFVDTGNLLCKLVDFPWKTVVIDNLSDLSDASLQHISAFQSGAMGDARVWAAMVGAKTIQVVTAFNQIKAHVVFLLHSQIDKNELTSQIIEVANLYSKVRDVFGKLFSQYFYAAKVNGKPMIYTTDQGFVRGIGARWPAGLPAVCAPDFNSVYGKELA